MYYFQLTGGLGNQLFQYAAARALALTTQRSVKFYYEDSNTYSPRHFELDKFQLNLNMAEIAEIPGTTIIDRVKRKLNIVNFFVEKAHFKFDGAFFKQKPKTYFIGYWQNEQYFLNYRKILLNEMQLSEKLDTKNIRLKALITNQNSVAVHVRRGDYLENNTAQQFHGICTLSYYQAAVKYIAERQPSSHYYIFSDDSDWVSKNFHFLPNKTIVTGNLTEPAIDLHLMSCCQHQIIANSSFSWWAAWLNTNVDKMVIAPQKWTNQHVNCAVLPKDWITI